MNKPKILVIVGPTASGKTSLSIELALALNGEVISADSRQVYRGLDLGSGKVTHEEMKGVSHHMLDVADPRFVYTVADYVRDGRIAVDSVLQRNRLPIVVGGSFFYVDALLGRVSLPHVAPNETLRKELDSLSTDELYTYLQEKDPQRAESIDKDNRRRLVRAIEVSAELGAVPLPYTEPLYDALMLGINPGRETLRENIHTRLLKRLDQGMVAEVKKLLTGGITHDRLDSFGLEYRYIGQHLEGKISYEEMCSLIEIKSMQFAKRQMTWLKRDKEIVWVETDKIENIKKLIKDFCLR